MAGPSVEQLLQDADGNRNILQGTKISGWVDDPSFRGTSSILWSCTITILASVYNAIHVNIPVRHVSTSRNLLHKIRWSLIALLVPELMLQLALKQYFAARKLINQLNADTDQTRTTGNKKPKPKYDMAYGFYVEMGGLVVNISNISNNYQFAAITARGARRLAEAGYVFDVATERIQDQSKSNVFTKILVCIQVSWMFIQCVTRASIGYPLTLLELHTMTHVVCAVILYILWWHKPHDIGESTVIDNDSAFHDKIAMMLMASQESPYRGAELLWTNFSKNLASTHPGVQDGATPFLLSISDVPAPDLDGKVHLKSGQHLECGLGPDRDQTLTAKDVRRWEACVRAAPGRDTANIISYYRDTVKSQDHADSITGLGLSNGSFFFLPVLLGQIMTSWYLILATLLLPLVYGAVHLTAWNFAFPTPTESILWKVSSFGIMSFVPIAMVLNTVFSMVACFEPLEPLLPSLALLLPLLFLFYRSYLVIESYISLRYLPLGAYATIPWLQAIPHL